MGPGSTLGARVFYARFLDVSACGRQSEAPHPREKKTSGTQGNQDPVLGKRRINGAKKIRRVNRT